MNALADSGYATPITTQTIPYDGLIAPRVRIAPRTLAKMRDMDYLHLARQRFLFGTECRSPVEVVESGAKSIFDWCMCLAEARSEVGRPEHHDN
jgi:hypothetical protein